MFAWQSRSSASIESEQLSSDWINRSCSGCCSVSFSHLNNIFSSKLYELMLRLQLIGTSISSIPMDSLILFTSSNASPSIPCCDSRPTFPEVVRHLTVCRQGSTLTCFSRMWIENADIEKKDWNQIYISISPRGSRKHHLDVGKKRKRRGKKRLSTLNTNSNGSPCVDTHKIVRWNLNFHLFVSRQQFFASASASYSAAKPKRN